MALATPSSGQVLDRARRASIRPRSLDELAALIRAPDLDDGRVYLEAGAAFGTYCVTVPGGGRLLNETQLGNLFDLIADHFDMTPRPARVGCARPDCWALNDGGLYCEAHGEAP